MIRLNMRINVRVSSDVECLWWRALLLSDNNSRVNPELERLEKLLPMLSQLTGLDTIERQPCLSTWCVSASQFNFTIIFLLRVLFIYVYHLSKDNLESTMTPRLCNFILYILFHRVNHKILLQKLNFCFVFKCIGEELSVGQTQPMPHLTTAP